MRPFADLSPIFRGFSGTCASEKLATLLPLSMPGSMPADCRKRNVLLKVSKGTIAYDASFAKSKVPFASTVATFRGRSFEPAVVVLHKSFHMGFSGDAHMSLR